ncbi:N-acetyltransferase 9, partial [Spiromyces aspiralis]
MKINANTVLIGSRVVLVPYEKEHVPTYHQWMKDPLLQELTASEPLTLEEEYQMQESWRNDNDKCTFILVSRSGSGSDMTPRDSLLDVVNMIGDINLYLNDYDDPTVAEIEVMVADPKSRGMGIGREAVQIMMHYAITKLGTKRFIAKILSKNKPSISLFISLGFTEIDRSEVFQQIDLTLTVTPQTRDAIHDWTKHVVATTYHTTGP